MELVLSKEIFEILEQLALLCVDTSISDKLKENVATVLSILTTEYLDGLSWIFEFHLCKREDDCISIDWLHENIYCCIYSDLVHIDKTKLYPNQIVIHDDREFEVINTESIYSNFKLQFESLCLTGG